MRILDKTGNNRAESHERDVEIQSERLCKISNRNHLGSKLHVTAVAVGISLLRTPNAGNANNVRICNTGNGGALNNNNANNANAVAPIGRTVSFEYRKGKQCLSRKEFASCIRKERNGYRRWHPSG